MPADPSNPQPPAPPQPQAGPRDLTAGRRLEPAALVGSTRSDGSDEVRYGQPTEVQDPAEIEQGKVRSSVLRGERPLAAPAVQGYRVLRLLGEGTYGSVWLFEEEGTGIQVAIKFFLRGRGQLDSLQREVKKLALLDAAPGIVQLKDVNGDADPPYLVMAYAEGGSLAQRLEQGPLPLPQALALFRQAAEALAYVHAKGIRHCDLKPGNVLLDVRGRALLADFGQAALPSDAAPSLGTYFYMSPEQAELAPQVPDTRWDVYALGALFYAMLTGRPPREDVHLRGQLAQTADPDHRLRLYREGVAAAPAPRSHRDIAGMDRLLAEIIDRCLDLDPERRLRDAGAVLAALDRRDRQRRQRPLLAFALLAPLLLTAVTAVSAYSAFGGAVENSRGALTEQLLESEHDLVRLAARTLKEGLQDRLEILRRQAADPRLRRAAADEDRAAVQELLRQFREQFKERDEISTLTLVNERGDRLLTVWRGKEDLPDQRADNFRYRGWFHGGLDVYDGPAEHLQPVRRPHISHPYFGSVSKEGVVSISAPVFAPGNRDEVAGVLLVSLLRRKLHWLMDRPERPTDLPVKNGVLVLVNEHGHCLLHRQHDPEVWDKIEPRLGQNPRSWLHDSPVFAAVLRGEEGTVADYEDPIDRRRYLAAYAPLEGMGWGVVVQHESAVVTGPIQALRGRMLAVAVTATSILGLLTFGLWGWLFWTLRREERHAHV